MADEFRATVRIVNTDAAKREARHYGCRIEEIEPRRPTAGPLVDVVGPARTVRSLLASWGYRPDEFPHLFLTPDEITATAAYVAQMKGEILADVAAGVVPVTVIGFSQLHDYSDANRYGWRDRRSCPLLDADTEPEPTDGSDRRGIELVAYCQDVIDGWIRSGGLANAAAVFALLDADPELNNRSDSDDGPSFSCLTDERHVLWIGHPEPARRGQEFAGGRFLVDSPSPALSFSTDDVHAAVTELKQRARS